MEFWSVGFLERWGLGVTTGKCEKASLMKRSGAFSQDYQIRGHYSVTSAIFAKKAKTFSHGNGTATKKAFHFRWSSTFVGDKFFLVPARSGWGNLNSFGENRREM
jgi:hypothetical protein